MSASNTEDSKKPTPLMLFKKQIAGLTTLSASEVIKFAAFLKGRKDMATWKDSDIVATLPEWRVIRDQEKKDEAAEEEVSAVKAPKKAKEEVKEVKEVKAVKEVKEIKAVKAVKEVKAASSPSQAPSQSQVTATVSPCAKDSAEGGCIYFRQNRCNKGAAERHPRTVVMVKSEDDPSPPAAIDSVSTLEFHFLEATKKVATATAIADKAESDAKLAATRAEEAMRVALDLKAKSAAATMTASESRAIVVACQKEADARSAEFEKANAKASTVTLVDEGSSEPLHVRRKKIPTSIKTLVWNKYIGPDVAQADCVSCRTAKISVRSFHCGHVIADAKGGDMTINNLRPICAPCNGGMGTRSMNEFTKEYFGWTV
jgi:hypothetical protein